MKNGKKAKSVKKQGNIKSQSSVLLKREKQKMSLNTNNSKSNKRKQNLSYMVQVHFTSIFLCDCYTSERFS